MLAGYGLCALKKHVLTPHLKLAIVCFGANDAVQEGGGESGENLHVPLHVFRTNLEGIISALRAHSPSVHVVLITPPTVDATLWPNRTPQRTAAYAQVVREVGNAVNTNHNSCRQSHHVRVLDLWAAGETECVGKGKEGREGGSEAVNLSDLCDGIHLAPSGNDKVSTFPFYHETADISRTLYVTLYAMGLYGAGASGIASFNSHLLSCLRA